MSGQVQHAVSVRLALEGRFGRGTAGQNAHRPGPATGGVVLDPHSGQLSDFLQRALQRRKGDVLKGAAWFPRARPSRFRCGSHGTEIGARATTRSIVERRTADRKQASLRQTGVRRR